MMVVTGILSLVLGLVRAECEGGTCSESITSDSLLQFSSHRAKGLKESQSCAELKIDTDADHFDVSKCASLAVGQTCEVTCASGFIGTPAKYFCFSQQARAGEAPISVRPPLCRPKDKELFAQGERLPVSKDGSDCLSCTTAFAQCSVIPDATGPSDPRCTSFFYDKEGSLLRVPHVSWQCLDNFGSGRLGLWSCNRGANQLWRTEEPVAGTPGRLATRSGRGTILVYRVGEPIYGEEGVQTPLSTIMPAVDSLKEGKKDEFLKRMHAVQHCKARLEGDVPDSFWTWLKTQPKGMRGSLFSTFPVVPNQVKLLGDLVSLAGADTFKDEGVTSFAVGLTYQNRHQKISEMALAAHSSYNGYPYLSGQDEQARDANRRGEWVGISSNECNHLPRCCGHWETWKFKYPRQPVVRVGEWFQWWLKTVDEKKDKLWHNPLANTPWVFNTYLWPSAIKDCEWVHKKLIDGEPMEGRWYLYDGSFHNRVCAGGKYFPNEIPGIAVYGGVCGRLAELEWRKSSCMGVPAHQKNEPGHCAGFKFLSETGIYTTLTVVSGIPKWPENTCLKCERHGTWCESRPIDSPECTVFRWDGRLMHAPNGQCVDVAAGPWITMWGCSGGANQLAKQLDDGSIQIFSSGRAKPIFRPANGKPLPTETQTKWRYSAFHTVTCAKWNCHFRNALHLNSANAWSEYTHTEAAVALANAVGEYEQDGIWPTAYNEARLAASLGWSLLHNYKGVDKSKIETLVLWALNRNPSLYEAWTLAGQLPSEETSNELKEMLTKIEDQPFRRYYNSLRLFSTHAAETERTQYHRELANRLVREHVIADKMRDHWSRHPALLLRLVGKFCMLLEDEVVRELDAMENSCGIMRRLVQGSEEAWGNLEQQMANGSIDESITNAGNDDFEQAFHVLAHLVMSNIQHERSTALIRELLKNVAVGYVNKRTQTFYAEHGRVLLRGPYAGLLQLAGELLPMAEREELLKNVKNILEHPVDNWDRILSALGEEDTTTVADWLAQFSGQNMTNHGGKPEEDESVSDSTDGFEPNGQANMAVMDEMKTDKAADLERGYHIWEEANTEQEDQFNIQHILETLLRIHLEDLPESADDSLKKELGAVDEIHDNATEEHGGNVTGIVDGNTAMENNEYGNGMLALTAAENQAEKAFTFCVDDFMENQ